MRRGFLQVRIRLLHRELFREMGLIGLICLSALLCLILLGRMLQLRGLFMGQGVSFWDLGKLFIYLSPFFLLFLVPVSGMLGIFLTLLRMGADRELTSLRAGGISIWSLLPAPLALSLVCTGISLWMSLAGISWGMSEFRHTVVELARNKTAISISPGVFNTSYPSLVVYARQSDPATDELRDVFVLDRSRPKVQATIVASSGQIDSNPEQGQVFFLLKDGHLYRDVDNELSVISFDRYLVMLDMSRLLGGIRLDDASPKEMSWEKLTHGDFTDRNENFQRRVEIETHKRLALPMACLILGLFAFFLAFAFQGISRQYGLLVSLGSFFFYYILLSGGMALAEGGVFSAAIGVWFPNVLFFILGLLGLWWVAQEREINMRGLGQYFWELVRRTGT